MTGPRSTESVDTGLSCSVNTDHVARRTSAKKGWTGQHRNGKEREREKIRLKSLRCT